MIAKILLPQSFGRIPIQEFRGLAEKSITNFYMNGGIIEVQKDFIFILLGGVIKELNALIGYMSNLQQHWFLILLN